MKPSLQFNLSQQLTLTPQLQQAIRLLQLSTLDLVTEIQQVVESNPMLEMTTDEKSDDTPQEASEAGEGFEDDHWSYLNPYPQKPHYSVSDEDFNLEHVYGTTDDLQSHMQWQLNLTPMSETDKAIGLALIDSLNDDGFLTQSLEDIANDFKSTSNEISLDDIKAVCHRLQHFDPIGCFCHHLSETLIFQLGLIHPAPPTLPLAMQMVQDDLTAIGQHNYRYLQKKYQIKENVLQEIIQLIKSLHPRPGSIIIRQDTQYIVPDVMVRKHHGEWVVSLNPYSLPKLTLNQQYTALIKRAEKSADNQYLKTHLQEAKWFLKSINSRQETLLNVARYVMTYQKDFLEHGEEAMKPLVLSEVAYHLSLHESTISRVTTQKYIHTPKGVFELKYFFSSHVNTDNGGECSSTAIRALIKKLIGAENREKPLSDSKLATLMQKQGIQVARRTVAKYREGLGIAPSNERKLLTRS